MAQNFTEDRRSEVNELLKECVDQKVLMGGTEEALKKARKAYELATSQPPLPAPWPQLAAYRLGHLLMRSKSLTVDALREIDQLFSKASHESLGPLPPIYHLAVLFRLKSGLRIKSQKDEINMKMDLVYDLAFQRIRSRRQLQPSNSETWNRTGNQDTEFNLLELAGYFLGRPYQKMDGLGENSLDPMRPGNWRIIGRNIDPILMTEKLARCEFNSRATSDNYLLIELTTGSVKWGLSADKMKEVNSDYAILLLLCVDKSRNGSKEFWNEGLKKHFRSKTANDPYNRFRKIKERTNKEVQKIMERSDLQIFDSDGYLNDEIKILGLVNRQYFR